jgi:hypothetical protein
MGGVVDTGIGDGILEAGDAVCRNARHWGRGCFVVVEAAQ